jgi:hypothetical protein
MGRLGQRRDSERDSERLARNKGLEGAGTVDAIVTLPPTCVYGVRGRQRNETSTRTDRAPPGRKRIFRAV